MTQRDLTQAQALSFNALERPAIGLMPEIRTLMERFEGLGARAVEELRAAHVVDGHDVHGNAVPRIHELGALARLGHVHVVDAICWEHGVVDGHLGELAGIVERSFYSPRPAIVPPELYKAVKKTKFKVEKTEA